MNIFIDADILIDNLRGKEQARLLLKKLFDSNDVLWVGAMQQTEILFYTRSASDHENAQDLLSNFLTGIVDKDTVQISTEMYKKYHLSHGTGRNDAILAATVYLHQGILYTNNIKHFPMKEIKVKKGF